MLRFVEAVDPERDCKGEYNLWEEVQGGEVLGGGAIRCVGVGYGYF